MFYNGHRATTMLTKSSNPHRLNAMQFKRPIRKGATLFLVQWFVVGEAVEDIVVEPYGTMLWDFVDVFQPIPMWNTYKIGNGPYYIFRSRYKVTIQANL